VAIVGTAQVEVRARLRELSPEEFEARYDCDRFTAGVLAHKFGYVIEHMVSRVMTGAFSPIIRDSTDLSATVQGPPSMNFALAAVSQTIPLFVGSIPEGVRLSLEEYGLERLSPGDTIIVNDYYRVGTHLNDACFVHPVFADGAELIGAVAIRAHMLDMGGRAAGGFDATKVSTYEDGLVLPPTLLFDRGEPVRSVFSLLMDNTRFGPMIVPDIRTIHSALRLGDELIQEALCKYGLPAYLGAIRYTCDASAEQMATALERLPDGVYEATEIMDGDALENSEEYRVRVKATKRHGRVEFDLSGSSHSSRSAVNCAWPDAKTAVAIALKSLVDPRSPYTSGALRSVDIVLPPDAFIDASPPHACQFYWEPVQTIIFAIYRALKEALGPDAAGADGSTAMHLISGRRADGSEWVTVPEGSSSPWPATREGDGDSNQMMLMINMLISGVEPWEAGVPATVMAREVLPDSGGPGEHRGGCAGMLDTLWVEPTRHYASHFHLKRPPAGGGVYGGRPGSLAGIWLWDSDTCDIDLRAGLPSSLDGEFYRQSIPLAVTADPNTHTIAADGQYFYGSKTVDAGPWSFSRLLSNGAPGWGDPYRRDPVKVMEDVRDEYVSIEGAARDYGVVVLGDPHWDPEGLTIDEGATKRLRLRANSSVAPSSDGHQTSEGIDADWPWAISTVEREPIRGDCPECGESALQRYPVLSDGGWIEVVKCQVCLGSVSRLPWKRLGWATREDGLQ
jgi:N-methylhydantoinase B